MGDFDPERVWAIAHTTAGLQVVQSAPPAGGVRFTVRSARGCTIQSVREVMPVIRHSSGSPLALDGRLWVDQQGRVSPVDRHSRKTPLDKTLRIEHTLVSPDGTWVAAISHEVIEMGPEVPLRHDFSLWVFELEVR